MPFDARVDRYRESFARSSEAAGPAGAIVAEAEGEIVGLAVCAGQELRDLYVVPEAWGSDVATALHRGARGDSR